MQARDPQIAVDGQGDVTVAWVSGTSSKDVFVAEHPAGGEWTSPLLVISDPTPANSCEAPRLAVNAAGAAIVIADCGSGSTAMRAALRSAAGTWSVTSTEVPGTGEGGEPRVANDDAGDAVLIWEGAASTLKSAYRPAAGPWSGVTTLSSQLPAKSGEEASSSVATVAMSHDGYSFALWREAREETVSDPVIQIRTARKEKAGSWTAAGTLTNNFSTTPVTVGEPQIAVNGSGQKLASWTVSNPGPTVFGQTRASSSVFGGWSEPAAALSEASTYVELPQAAIDGSGLGVAAWRSFATGGGIFRMKAATTSSLTGSWSTPGPVTIGEPSLVNGVGSVPALALNAAGDAAIVWGRGTEVEAVTRPAGGGFGAATQISTAGHRFSEVVRTAVDPGGNPIAIWTGESSPTHIDVAVDDVTPPTVSATVPGTATTGTAVAMSASASDTWSPVSLSWDFGDGTTATGAAVSHSYATAGTKTVTVTATDAAGHTATASASITASPPSGGGGKPVALTVKVPAQTRKQIAKAKAIKIKCKLDVAGTCRAQATLAAGVARRLGLAAGKGRKPVKLGGGSVQATAGKFAVVKVKLGGKAAKIGAASAKVPIKLLVTGSAPGRDSAQATRKLVVSPR